MLKSFVKNSFNYYLSRNEYYDSVVSENSFIKRVTSNLNDGIIKRIKTKERIQFNNKLPLNVSKNEVIARLGKNCYQLDKSRAYNHSILFYKQLIGGLRTRFELHFVEEQLVIGFITFDIASANRKLKILNALNEKYDVDIDQSSADSIRIEDSYDNYIQIIDSVNITLAYGIDSLRNNKVIYNLSNERELEKISELKRESLQLQNNL